MKPQSLKSLEAEITRLRAYIADMQCLIEYSAAYLNDATQWEGDDHLGPMWQELYNRNPQGAR